MLNKAKFVLPKAKRLAETEELAQIITGIAIII